MNAFFFNKKGIQIIEKDCEKAYHSDLDNGNFKIECVFFQNPREGPAFWETKRDDAPKNENSVSGGENPSESNPNSENVVVDPSSPTEQLQSVTEEDRILKINENESENDSNYIFTIEQHGEANTGLYKAVLKFKNVRHADYKNYTFKIKDISKSFRLYETECKLY
jgi:ssDNA-specific exonuclease RecJ